MADELEPAPIIIYGAPRSGTTYLTELLNQHPDVFVTNETGIFVWAHQSLNILPQEEPFFFHSHRDQFTEYLHERCPDLIRDFYRRLGPGKRYWGDKNPHYVDPKYQGCLELITSFYPGTKFIHIVRDGRDVVSSLVRKGWVNFEVAHRVWVNFPTIGRSFGRSQPAGCYLELRYEQLIDDDAAVAAEILGFLGLEATPSVLEFCAQQRVERTPFRHPTRDLTRGAEASDWAGLLTQEEQLHSLELIGEQLVELGYETPSSLATLRASIGGTGAAEGY